MVLWFLVPNMYSGVFSRTSCFYLRSVVGAHAAENSTMLLERKDRKLQGLHTRRNGMALVRCTSRPNAPNVADQNALRAGCHPTHSVRVPLLYGRMSRSSLRRS